MSEHDLDTFARLLMQLVRDRALVAIDAYIAGSMRDAQGKRWARLEGPVKEALHELVPDVVDQVLFELLAAVDEGELPLIWDDPVRGLQRLEEVGMSELAGLLWYGEGDWRDTYSAQRFNDYLADVHLVIDWEQDSN